MHYTIFISLQSLSLLKTQNKDDEHEAPMTPNGINTKSSYEFDNSLMSIKKISLSHNVQIQTK